MTFADNVFPLLKMAVRWKLASRVSRHIREETLQDKNFKVLDKIVLLTTVKKIMLYKNSGSQPGVYLGTCTGVVTQWGRNKFQGVRKIRCYAVLFDYIIVSTPNSNS